jgi:hypothetical protein
MGAILAVLGAEATAVFYIAAFVCFIMAAFTFGFAGNWRGGSIGLVALGLALWIFPLMWNTVDQAFD